MTFYKCGFNHFLLLPDKDAVERSLPAGWRWQFLLEPGFVHRKSFTLVEDDGALNDVL